MLKYSSACHDVSMTHARRVVYRTVRDVVLRCSAGPRGRAHGAQHGGRVHGAAAGPRGRRRARPRRRRARARAALRAAAAHAQEVLRLPHAHRQRKYHYV